MSRRSRGCAGSTARRARSCVANTRRAARPLKLDPLAHGAVRVQRIVAVFYVAMGVLLPVRVAGPMDVRLLPSPSLVLSNIEIGKPGDAQALRAKALGIDTVHFGIVFTVNLAIGLFHPPFGINIFVAQSVLGIRLETIYRGILPFVLLYLIALVLITYVPDISLIGMRLLFN